MLLSKMATAQRGGKYRHHKVELISNFRPDIRINIAQELSLCYS